VDYSFSYDEPQILLMITLNGYWSLDTFNSYRQEYLAWHDKIRTRHRHYRAFGDCVNYPVQSNEVGQAYVALFSKLMSENRGYNAILAASALNKMQAQRVIPQPNVKVFTERKTAMDWLVEPGSLPG
jgi:hypothetical protein